MSNSIPAPSLLAKKKELNLFGKSWVRNSHVAEIAAILRTNTSLTFVGFRECCGVGDKGAASIASALEDNSTVKKLNFESTKVGDSGASALAQVLEMSSVCTLHRLDLAYCPIGDEGAISLARALAQETCSLVVLHLDHCPQITDVGGRALLAVLTENMSSHLTSLGLKGTSVSAEVRAQVDSILRSKEISRNNNFSASASSERRGAPGLRTSAKMVRPPLAGPPPPPPQLHNQIMQVTAAPKIAAVKIISARLCSPLSGDMRDQCLSNSEKYRAPSPLPTGESSHNNPINGAPSRRSKS